MEKNKIGLQGSIWMTVEGEKLGGSSLVALLAKIAQYGSITRAAKSIRMSYKAAWRTIDAMNNLAGEPLVERLTGGKGGGGTRLTPRGEQLVANFNAIEQEHRNFVNNLGRKSGGVTDDYFLIGRMSMRTSARNQFYGKVASIKRGSVNDEITVEVAGGHEIVAIITCESTRELGLAEGSQVLTLIKASFIILVTGNKSAKFSARNRLKGVVSRVEPGAVNTEVTVDLPKGGAITAVVTNVSSELLGLKPGKKVTAIFKASSVILGSSV